MAHGRREDAGCLDRPQARAGPCAPQVALLVLTRAYLSRVGSTPGGATIRRKLQLWVRPREWEEQRNSEVSEL